MSEEKTEVEASNVERFVINRQQAIRVFFTAIHQDDPYWIDLIEAADESLLIFDDTGNDIVSWPSQWDVGKALGFTTEEMEKGTGMEPGRLKELGL